MKQEIAQLTDLLVHSNTLVPFLPTTIDELILRRSDTGWAPGLEPRWPFDGGNTMFVAPEPCIAGPFELFATAPEEEKPMFPLVRSLAEAVISQIDSRDRRLVEQSQALLAWRPCFNGHPSGGVANEIAHRRNLVELLGETHRKVFILNRPTDLGLFRVEAILDEVEQRAGRLPTPRSALREGLASSALKSLGEDAGRVSAQEIESVADPSGSVRFPLPRILASSLGPDPAVAQRLANARHWSEIATVANSIMPPFDLYPTDSVTYDGEITVPEYVRRVEAGLSSG